MIIASPFADVEIPDVDLSAYVLGAAAARGDQPALVDAATGEAIGYRALAEAADAGAAGLAAVGIGPGDVVGLVSHNQPRFAVALHAALRARAAVTPLNPVLTVDEITKQLADARVRVLVSAEPVADKAAAAAGAAGVERVYVLGHHPSARPFAELLEVAAAPPAVDLDPSTALAALPYSSGTTGASKGVMLTHRNLVANLEQFRGAWRLDDDVVCAAIPFFHIYGFTVILNAALLAGATVVTMPRFDLRHYLATIEKYRVTRGHFAPPIVLSLATAPEVDEYDLSSLRRAVCGAAPLDEAVTARAERRIGCLIRQGYGMTEAGPGTHLVPDDRFDLAPAGSVGWVMAGTEARVVDPATGVDVPPGTAGEIWVRGPQVMQGYLGHPQATAATLVDGEWLRTGDLGRADDEGRFWIVDRVKELIKYKGYQVAPAELEAVLLAHPDVVDAAVIGVAHPTAGEAPKAFVVASTPLDAGELMAWVAARVAPYKRIREVAFVDAIPRSPTGKILRRLLRDPS